VFRKHTISIFTLTLVSAILYYLEFSNNLSLKLSVFLENKLSYALLVCFVSIFILTQSKNRKRQISIIKISSFINVIYILKSVFFSDSTAYGFIYLALVTILLAISLSSLKKDQELIDSMDRLR
tara:strand:+ start:51 stop:422 length:372 start_codon:yes stop_codon:yes gene_type:complete